MKERKKMERKIENTIDQTLMFFKNDRYMTAVTISQSQS